MKKLFPALVALSLLAGAGSAAAQASAPAPAATPAQAPATPPAPPSAAKPPERPALILRLDEIEGPRMNFGSSAGERYPARDLPTLGGDARPVAPASPDSAFPYPKDAKRAD